MARGWPMRWRPCGRRWPWAERGGCARLSASPAPMRGPSPAPRPPRPPETTPGRLGQHLQAAARRHHPHHTATAGAAANIGPHARCGDDIRRGRECCGAGAVGRCGALGQGRQAAHHRPRIGRPATIKAAIHHIEKHPRGLGTAGAQMQAHHRTGLAGEFHHRDIRPIRRLSGTWHAGPAADREHIRHGLGEDLYAALFDIPLARSLWRRAAKAAARATSCRVSVGRPGEAAGGRASAPASPSPQAVRATRRRQAAAWRMPPQRRMAAAVASIWPRSAQHHMRLNSAQCAAQGAINDRKFLFPDRSEPGHRP